ncbi:MAG TPA: ComEC/Rec2 family competence protein [Tepidisphaeraceae bacterium]|jgi:competence protein ComEC
MPAAHERHEAEPFSSRPHARGVFARRPLVPIAVAVLIGCGLHGHLPVVPWLWLALSSVAAVSAIALRSKPAGASLALVAACGLAAAAMAQAEKFRYSDADLARYTADGRRMARVELKIVDPPRIFSAAFGQSRPLPPRQVALAQVTRVATWDGWRPAAGEVMLTLSEPDPRLVVGQTVRALAMLDRPAPAMNPGQFDWAAYYRRRRVLTSVQVLRAAAVAVVEQAPPSLLHRWRAWTRDRLADGFTDGQSLDHALLRALVLGDSDPELRDVQEQFRATGTSHHLAISGMHIAVIGGVVFALVRLARGSPRLAWTLALGVVALYFAAALPAAPVVRSVLLWTAVGAAILWRRAVDPINLLAGVVCAMLAVCPLDLFDPGFQLSFATVLGLVLLTLPLSRALGGVKQTVETPSTQYAWLSRAAAYVDSRIILTIAAALAAWFVSMPIVAGHFGQLNLWAILASVALGPVVLIALVGGAAKIVLSGLFPAASGVLADAAQLPVMAMRNCVEQLARLPAGDVPLPGPAWWVVLLYFAALLLAARPWQRQSARLAARLSFGAALALVIALPFALGAADSRAAGATRVTLLAVGAGQCAVIEPPGGRVVLIDAGSSTLADPVRRCIAPFLRQRGITSIDTLVISHANADHFSAVAELAESYAVREVLVAGGFDRAAETNPAVRAMLSELRDLDRPPRQLREGDVLPLGADTALHVVWSRDDTALSDNDRSLVLRLDHAGRRLLLPGDIEDAAMSALAQRPGEIAADVLLAPHHGSSESATAAFLAAVKPRAVLSSNDRTLTGKQRTFDKLVGNTPLHRTHESGAVTVLLGGEEGVVVEPFARRRRP